MNKRPKRPPNEPPTIPPTAKSRPLIQKQPLAPTPIPEPYYDRNKLALDCMMQILTTNSAAVAPNADIVAKAFNIADLFIERATNGTTE